MNFLDKCSILTGITISEDDALVVVMNDGLAEERQQHAIPLLFRNNTWSVTPSEPILPWIAAGVGIITDPVQQIAIVGWGGQVLMFEKDKTYREAIQRSKNEHVSIIRSVASVDGNLYAVGMKRQAYLRKQGNNWTEIDQNVAYKGKEIAIGFNKISGFNNSEIYAVGLNGEIWRYDSNHWHEVATLTNVPLFSVCCAPDGNVYIGGKSGIFILGRHQSWEILDTDMEETIWDIHCFKNQIYIMTNKDIYMLINKNLKKIKNNLLEHKDFLCFSSSKEKLWIFGRKAITQHDGISWSALNTDLPTDINYSPTYGFFTGDVLITGSDYLDEEI